MASRYDGRLLEIAAQREAERAADRTGLDRIAQSTETVTRGMADPLNWVLGIASILLIPVTGGLSVGLGVIALLRLTGGGRAYVQAIPPAPADLVAPGPGCVRIVAALGSLILLLIIILLFCAAIAYNLGVQP